MSIVLVQSHGGEAKQHTQHTEAPSQRLHPHPAARQDIPEEIVLESETCLGLGRPTSVQTVHMAHLTSSDRRGPRLISRGATSTQHVNPSQGLGNTSYNFHSYTDFQMITVRPPLRPTPSHSTDTPFSYYSSASLDLQHKSLAVAAKEEADSLRDSSKYSAPVCLATLLTLNLFCGIDASVLVLILPAISRQLDTSSHDVFWIIMSYLLSAALVKPLSMRICSATGVKISMLFGGAVWTAGSLGCALSASFAPLIAARCINGAGAGILGVSMLPTLHQLQADQLIAVHERLLSLSYWLGLAIGPAIGFAFMEAGAWQYVFIINTPTGLMIIIGVMLCLRIPRPVEWRQALRDIEYAHWILLPAAFIPLHWALIAAGTSYSWTSWHILLPLIASSVCFASWCLCASISASPILPVSILRNPRALTAAIGAVAHGMNVSTTVCMVPLQAMSYGLGGTASFGVLVSWTLTIAVSSSIGWDQDSRAGRIISLFAWPLLTTTMGLMLLLNSSILATTTLPLGMTTGLVLGLLTSHLSTSFQSAASTDDETIHAAPTLSFLTSLGNSLGLAVTACVFLNTVPSAHVSDVFSTIDGALDTSLLLYLTTAFHSVWLTLCVLNGIMSVLTIVCAFVRRPSGPEFTIEDLKTWPSA